MKSSCRIIFLSTAILIVSDTYATSNLAPPPNIRVTNIPELNNEEQVWICPTDSNIIIAVWRDFRLGYRQVAIGRSTDGGQTWSDSLIYFGMQVFFGDSWQSDPTLTVDRMGNFYISVLDFDASGFTGSFIAFYKSTDKGISWTGPVTNVPDINPDIFEDKQFITVDRTGGPHDGNLYCSWTRFCPARMAFVRSIDGGTSFQDTIIFGPTQMSTGCGAQVFRAGQFSIPVVSSNGNVHVFWQGVVLDSGLDCSWHNGIKHVVSTDGGQIFGPENVLLEVSGRTWAANGIHTYSQPAADADITGGPFDGNIYISFTNIGPEDSLRSDVNFIRSTDNGTTWSSRLQINDDPDSHLNDSFHPWLIVNEEGVIIVVFYDTRFDPPNYLLFDLVAAYSFDGGETFTSNHRITEVSSDAGNLKNSKNNSSPAEYNEDGTMSPPVYSSRAGLIGEYIGVTAFHDKINAVWTDSRDGNSEVYTANWYLPILEPRLLNPDDMTYTTTNPLFSWATSWKHDQDRYRLEIASDSNFTSLQDSHIVDTNFILPIIDILEGDYFWRVKLFTTAGTDSSEYSDVRSFTIDRTPPDAVSLLIPANGTTIVDSTPEFDWSDVTRGAPVLYDLYLSLDSSFPEDASTTIYSDLTESRFVPPNPIQPDTVTYWRVVSRDLAGNNSTSESFSLRYIIFFCGDANNDQSEIPNILDLTFLVDYIFRGGPLPEIPAAADLDGSGGNPNIIDLTAMVDYIFRGGAQPTCSP